MFQAYLYLFFLMSCQTVQTIRIDIKTEHAVQNVSDKYLSFTIDGGILHPPKWATFDFRSERLRTLLRGLSPAYLRFGGTSADYVFYSDALPTKFDLDIKPTPLILTSGDWDNLVNLTRSTGLRFLYEFNIQLRYGSQWDPSNAIQLLDYLTSRGYGENLDFELGNEPDWFPSLPHMTPLSGSQIASDYAILQRLLHKYPVFSSSVLVGPDTGSSTTSKGHINLFEDFINKAGKQLTAATFHQYYFHGPAAHVKDYINASNFDQLRVYVETIQDVVKKSPRPDLPLWIGESSDSNGEGTPNVTDKFVSGFLWLDKLGLAARLGIGVVMRQTFYGYNYPLIGTDLQPNPDYWLSYLYKQLVSTEVLEVTMSDDSLEMSGGVKPSSAVRLYAHCTKPSSQYKRGAVTMFGLNVQPDVNSTITVGGGLGSTVHVYLMSAPSLTARDVYLNGKLLKLINDKTFRVLEPREQDASHGIKIPSLTYGFFVFPHANAKVCM